MFYKLDWITLECDRSVHILKCIVIFDFSNYNRTTISFVRPRHFPFFQVRSKERDMVAFLSISGPGLRNCDSVILAMKDLGIYGDITSNISVDPDGNVEPGCRVLIANKNFKEASTKLWERLKTECNLQCAHVRYHVSKEGCIFDVNGTSRCPSAGS